MQAAKLRRILAAGVVLTVCIALVSVLASPIRAASRKFTIQAGGRERAYRLYIPPGMSGKPAPTFVILHGAGSDAAQMESYSNFDSFAARHGLIAVYPDGIRRRWNDGRPFSQHATDSADDIGFLRILIARLVAKKIADPRQVYLAGISNGGLMSLHAACLMADTIAGIGVVAAAEPVGVPCPAPRPLPVIIFQGTRDRLIPFHGGPIAFGLGGRGEVTSNAATVDFWSKVNGCGADKVTHLPAAKDAPTRVAIHSYACTPGHGLENVVIEGGGHTWPGVHQGILLNAILGRVTHQIDANETMWRFFQSHTVDPRS